MAAQRLIVQARQALAVPREGDETATVRVASGDPVFYGRSRAVGVTNNLGTLTAGQSVGTAGDVWLISAGRSVVEVETVDMLGGEIGGGLFTGIVISPMQPVAAVGAPLLWVKTDAAGAPLDVLTVVEV